MAWWKTYKQYNHGKKDNQRINVCSMASKKMVGLVYERRWAKRNKTIFDWWKVLYHIKGGKTSVENSKNLQKVVKNGKSCIKVGEWQKVLKLDKNDFSAR